MSDSNLLRPNLIFIMPDQLRRDFLGCYGADFVPTPHIDRLAAEGVRYDNAYSPSPVCVPARASLLTGRDAVKNGVTGNLHWLVPRESAPGVCYWPEVLGAADYHTAAIGKMHFDPWDSDHGFAYRSICEDKRWPHIADDYADHLAKQGERKYFGHEHDGFRENKGAVLSHHDWVDTPDYFVGTETCRYLEERAGGDPFALMVGFPSPHCPYDPCPEFLEKVNPERLPEPIPPSPDSDGLRRENVAANKLPWNGVDYAELSVDEIRRLRHHYAALVHQVDLEVGRILETLERTGLAENTVVIFSSDHGDYIGDRGMVGKGTFYDEAARVPMLARVPGVPGGQVSHELVSLTDVTATLLAAAGVPSPASMADSQPLPGLGLTTSPSRSALFGCLSRGWMLRAGDWKLCKYVGQSTQLFNVKEDPAEMHNRALDASVRDVLDRLDRQLMQSVVDSFQAGHFDKLINPDLGLSSSPEYGQRGGRRIYPQPLA